MRCVRQHFSKGHLEKLSFNSIDFAHFRLLPRSQYRIQLDETRFLKSNTYLARHRPGVNIRSIRLLVLIQRKELFPYHTNPYRPFNGGKKCDCFLTDFDYKVPQKNSTILTSTRRCPKRPKNGILRQRNGRGVFSVSATPRRKITKTSSQSCIYSYGAPTHKPSFRKSNFPSMSSISPSYRLMSIFSPDCLGPYSWRLF